MTTYIAFLRGINVGAHNRMKMDALRGVFESLGFGAVDTYIPSGNVVFTAAGVGEAALREAIHDAIEAEFDYDVTVMIRTRGELADVVAGQPFDVLGKDGLKHYVTFLPEEATEEQVEAVLDAQNDAESFAVNGRAVYSELDKDALGDGRFTDIGDQIGMETTRRNWNVVRSVLDLASP